MAALPDYRAIMDQALEGASKVLDALFESLQAAPPSREELRARFEAIINAPDEETYERLKALFGQHFGQDAYEREWTLKLQREPGDGKS